MMVSRRNHPQFCFFWGILDRDLADLAIGKNYCGFGGFTDQNSESNQAPEQDQH
jgi:hypothetical protein